MGRNLDEIFNECYERVRSGERMESVLASYPEHAAELEKLLRTAFDIGRRGSYIQPRPEFRYWTGVRLQGAFEYVRRQKQQPRGRGFNWNTAWAVALTAIVIMVVSGITTAAAASNAMPDGALYPIKLATEQARLALTFSESAKAELYARYAEKRVIELETMAEQGKIEAAATAAEKLASHLETATAAITKITEVPQPTATVTTSAEPSPTTQQPAQEVPALTPIEKTPTKQPAAQEVTTTATSTNETTGKTAPEKTTRAEKAERLRNALENSTTRSLTTLQKAIDEAPPESKDRLQKVMDRLSEKGYRKDRHKDDRDSQIQDKEGGQGNTSPQEPSAPSTEKAPDASQQPGSSSKPSGQHSGPRNHRR